MEGREISRICVGVIEWTPSLVELDIGAYWQVVCTEFVFEMFKTDAGLSASEKKLFVCLFELCFSSACIGLRNHCVL